MAPTIDHLRVDHVIHVIHEFVDADGAPHFVGEAGLITELKYDWGTGEITMTWNREGRAESMRFLRESTTGPGNGRMKQFFEMGEYVPAPIEGKRLIPGIGYVPEKPPMPELTSELIKTADRFDDAITRVWALASRTHFDDAEAQLLALVNAPDRGGPLEREAAERLCYYATQHAYDDDRTVHTWLRERGISMWYSYGAQATSGGEGAERATHIRAAERAFQDLDRKLNRPPSRPDDHTPTPMLPKSAVVPLAAAALLVSGLPRLKERKLADIALVGVPADIKGPDNPEARKANAGRLSWTFSDTYFWASMGSITKYKQKMAVAVLAPDASAAEVDDLAYSLDISYVDRKQIRRETVGSGALTVWEVRYEVNQDRELAYSYLYVDRSKRLAIVWHAVAKEAPLNEALAQLPRIAASFRLLRDPVALFAEMRDAPRKEAESRATKVSTVQAMLRREGHPMLVPGKPVLHHDAYLEWMSDPEPRYQLLVPLGRVRAAANGALVNRPRPLRNTAYDALPGTIGWREVDDGEWRFFNDDNAYLPLPGIDAALTAKQQDRNYVYFYYVATVRVEETDDERLLTSLSWFLNSVPEVQRRWRDGLLVGPGKPETDGARK